MATTHGRRLLARALRLLLASLLISTLLGSVESSLSASNLIYNLGDAARSAAEDKLGKDEARRRLPWLWREPAALPDIEVEAKHLYQRTVTVEAGESSVGAVFDLYLDKSDPLYGLLQRTAARPVAGWEREANYVARTVFGFVSVNGRPLEFSLPELEVEEVTDIAHFRLRGEPLEYADLKGTPAPASYRVRIDRLDDENKVRPVVDEVIVNTDGVRVVPGGALPRAQSARRTHFADLRPLREAGLEFDLVPLKEAAGEPARTISYTLGRFNHGYYRPLQPLLLGLLYALPFLLFLRLRQYRELSRDRATANFFSLSLLILVLYSGVPPLQSLITVFYELPLDKPREYLGRFSPADGAWVLLTLFVVSLWPRMVRWWEARPRRHVLNPGDLFPAPRPRLAAAAAAFSLLLWVALFGWRVAAGLAPPGAGAARALREAPGLLLWSVALYASCAWLLYELSGRAWAAAAAGLPAAFAMFVILTLGELSFTFRLTPYLAAAFLIPFTFAFMRVVYPAARRAPFGRAWRRRSRLARLAGVAGVAALALLLVWPPQRYFYSLFVWGRVLVVAWALARLWVFALLAALLRALRVLSAPGASASALRPAERAVGEALALSFFFLPAQQWLFLPVSFSLGYLLLRRWVFDPAWPPRGGAESKEQLLRAVKDTISFNDAARALRLLRKEMTAKLGKGEVEFDAYEKKVESLDAVVEGKRRAMLENRPGGATALRLGPADSPWERARIFAWQGSLFALPWAALYVRDLAASTVPDDNVGLLSLITSAALSFSQWPLYGLFLGYFYPHVRGSNGMLKGLYFFLFVFVPLLMAHAVAAVAGSTEWSSFALWALQLFIQCMLLGFVTGDYETLRGAGLGWRHLIDVHNLGSLAAWGSSVLVAAGAAVTTLLTSGATSLISSGLKVFLPDVPLPGGK